MARSNVCIILVPLCLATTRSTLGQRFSVCGNTWDLCCTWACPLAVFVDQWIARLRGCLTSQVSVEKWSWSPGGGGFSPVDHARVATTSHLSVGCVCSRFSSPGRLGRRRKETPKQQYREEHEKRADLQRRAASDLASSSIFQLHGVPRIFNAEGCSDDRDFRRNACVAVVEEQ